MVSNRRGQANGEESILGLIQILRQQQEAVGEGKKLLKILQDGGYECEILERIRGRGEGYIESAQILIVHELVDHNATHFILPKGVEEQSIENTVYSGPQRSGRYVEYSSVEGRSDHEYS